MNPLNRTNLRLFINPLISVAILLSFFFVMGSLKSSYRYFDTNLFMYGTIPGFLFGLLYPSLLEKPIWKKIIFLILSTAINLSCYTIAMSTAYWGPKLEMVLLGSVIGALTETILFILLFGNLKSVKIWHFLSLIPIASVAALFLYAPSSILFFCIGILLWHGGVGFILWKIGTKNQSSSQNESKSSAPA